MADNGTSSGGKSKVRNTLAYVIICISVAGIAAIAGVSIWLDKANTMDIFHVAVPVLATWVGTVIAFYFGRENFESANLQVRELVEKISPEKRAKAPVTSIMRTIVNMVHYQIPKDKTEKDIEVSELLSKFTASATRLPVIDGDGKPKYMIHESSVNKYLTADGKKEAKLDVFLEKQKEAGFGFGHKKGFVVVSEETSLADAKQKMEETPGCQDIFVTKSGSPDEPLSGWVSNLRLAKYLEA